MRTKIYKPIFIVGCGRSGTTVLYELLAQHKDLSWISNYSKKLYPFFTPSAGFCSLYKSNFFQKIVKKPIKPSEGYRLWNWCYPVENSPNDPPLIESDVNELAKHKCRKLFADHIRYSNKKRFVNKNTRNSRRIRFLNKIFPDALFIHIIRDGRAVTASLLNVHFWKNLRPWFINGSEVSELMQKKDGDVILASKLWKAEVSKILEDKNSLKGNRYFEIKYENLMAEPANCFRELCEFCELSWSDNFEDVIYKSNLCNMNYKYKERLSERQIERVSSTLFDFASNLGYKY